MSEKLEPGRQRATDPDRVRRILSLRNRAADAVRDFFSSHGFLAADTPVRVQAPANEDHIDAFTADGRYLRTSPELEMKRLLAAGCERIYQLGPCFRQGERGNRHLPEFTMLEWYRAGADYIDVLHDAHGLLLHVCRACLGTACCTFRGGQIDFAAPWQQLSVDDAFAAHARVSPDEAVEKGMFEEVLVDEVEPHLCGEAPVVLCDYPSAIRTLAAVKPEAPGRAQRWELYAGGMELANACTELTDPQEQRRRFAAARRFRETQNRAAYPVDEHYMNALEQGLPPSAGVALGFDRLLILLTDAPSIDDIVLFPAPHAR